jgi:two-component system, NtrC family, sensor kinase
MSFRTKTIIGVAIIEITLLLLIVIQSINYLEESNSEQLLSRAKTTANLSVSMAKDAVLSYDLASLETFLDEILANQGILYGRILDGQGRVLSEKGDPLHLEKPFVEDETLEVIEDGTLDVSSQIMVEGETYGRIEMGFGIVELQKKIEEAGEHIAWIAFVEVVLSALFSALLGGFLTRRLGILKRASERIAMGDFDVKVGFKEKDEIGQVGSTFDLMVQNLKHTRKERLRVMEELKVLNENLEQIVEERTEKLSQSNQALAKEKKEQEELILELETTRQQLIQSEKMASIGQLSAGIAHEINNPVGFIMSNMDSLKEQFEDMVKVSDFVQTKESHLPEEDLDQLKKLKESVNYEFILEDIQEIIKETAEGADRVKKIVGDLKDYSHFGDGERQEYDLNDGILSTLNIVKNEIKDNVEVETDLSEVPRINCSGPELNQVLMNMIVNAAQAIEVQGKISIRTELVDGMIKCWIEDDGGGIPEENLNKIFDPFFTTKPVGTGTGLGLSLSYSIVQNNGGEIEVESKVGEGTTFALLFPKNLFVEAK